MVRKEYSIENIRRLFLDELSPGYNPDEIKEFLYILCRDFSGWSKGRFLMELKTVLPWPEASLLLEALTKLKSGMPVQYITGKADFNGLSFHVNPDVLIPRQETAELAGIILEELSGKELMNYRILDIGTGSGCIAVFLKKKLPGARVFALDSSAPALETARKNAEELGTEIHFLQQDILSKNINIPVPEMDMIVSNPPYVMMKEKKGIRINVKEFEPSSALFVPDDDPLLYYRAIADHSPVILSEGGILFLEINESFGAEVAGTLLSRGFGRVEVKKDFFGKDRFIRAEFKI
jgi:release factor glutamine methyltransferase